MLPFQSYPQGHSLLLHPDSWYLQPSPSPPSQTTSVAVNAVFTAERKLQENNYSGNAIYIGHRLHTWYRPSVMVLSPVGFLVLANSKWGNINKIITSMIHSLSITACELAGHMQWMTKTSQSAPYIIRVSSCLFVYPAVAGHRRKSNV